MFQPATSRVTTGLIISMACMNWALTPTWAGPPLTPTPKQVTWSPEKPIPLPAGGVVIVLGDNASPAEQHAARMLRDWVARRFGQEWPVLRESRKHDAAKVAILLGQHKTHAWLARLCDQYGITVEAGEPGSDGYAIDMRDQGGQTLVLVAGSNGRAVIYGQDTLFQMLGQEDDRVTLARGSVRDFSSMPWRGRPLTHYRSYLLPGMLDCMMVSRINWMDLRNGTYAFEPDTVLDKAELGKVVTAAHERELIVYGTVNCGVARSEYDHVLAKFREFIDLGVDGLWISFDDKGAGEAPETLIPAVLEMGRQHGMTGQRIAVCPPKGTYQDIAAPFVAQMAKLGLADALMYFSVVPSAQALADAKASGMTCKPAWWHNWPRPDSGFTHIEAGSQHGGGRFSYMEAPSIAEGWHAPSYDELRDAAKYCASAMPWGGQGWGQYYITPIVGWWSWSPEQHDWRATRRRIYDIVYGLGQIEKLFAIDDMFPRVKAMFHYPTQGTEWQPVFPPQLNRLKDRLRALDYLNGFEPLVPQIAEGARKQSLLPPDLLMPQYVEPLRAEVQAGKRMASLSFPEYWWPEHQRAVLAAVYAGDMARANELIGEVKDRVLSEATEAGRQLSDLRYMKTYADWWTRQANLNAAGWKDLIQKRRGELAKRIDFYTYNVVTREDLFAKADKPPLGWATGRWQRQNKILAAVVPGEQEMWWGNWMAGIHREGEHRIAAFAFRHHTDGVAGAFAELPVSAPLSGDRRRLALMLYLANADKETIGLHYVEHRWAEHRYIRLLNGGRTLWEADLGVRRAPGEWFVIRLENIDPNTEQLGLTLRVEDRKDTVSYAVAFAGPIYLVQMGE